MKDQKHRNAYKRFWRNMRNANQAMDQADAATERATRSLMLAVRAHSEMRGAQ